MFPTTMSRVVSFINLPPDPHGFLAAALVHHSPVSIWTLREEYGGQKPGNEKQAWVVFKTHSEAVSALGLSHVVPALEIELEPFHKLRKLDVRPFYALQHKSSTSTLSSTSSSSQSDNSSFTTTHSFDLAPRSAPTADYPAFTISSNPPNPLFRQGDWICAAPTCAAHNFGRNSVCIGCSSQRPPPRMANNSPRFVPNPPQSILYSQQCILTPSGRAFAIGGRVQNINPSNENNPITMFWPDNEPFPHPGQIRPAGLGNGMQPPILNTGNRGPIESQPGDWICMSCQYLNWRRRRVCVSCYPFHAGADPSATAQAERIALLASLLVNHPRPLANMTPQIQNQNQTSVIGLLQALQMPPVSQTEQTRADHAAIQQLHLDQLRRVPMEQLRRPSDPSLFSSSGWNPATERLPPAPQRSLPAPRPIRPPPPNWPPPPAKPSPPSWTNSPKTSGWPNFSLAQDSCEDSSSPLTPCTPAGFLPSFLVGLSHEEERQMDLVNLVSSIAIAEDTKKTSVRALGNVMHGGSSSASSIWAPRAVGSEIGTGWPSSSSYFGTSIGGGTGGG